MSVIDYSSEKDLSDQKTGSVKTGSETTTVTTPKEDVKTEPEKLIVVDGPLSEIYTKALDTLLGDQDKENISQETQQMDAAYLLADIHAFNERVRDRKEFEQGGGAYIYVTDSGHLEGAGLVRVFNEIRNILGDKDIVNKAVCIEHDGNVTNRMVVLETYLNSQKVPVMFNRAAMLKYVKDLIKCQ